MSESKRWYAVYTGPHCEKKITKILTRSKIENYCPLNKVHKQRSDRKKFILEPLFTSYVFVKISETEHTLLKKTEGVINLIYWLGKPAVIRDVEIDLIKNFLSECTDVKLEKRPIYVNDSVSVIGGLIAESEGQSTGLKTRTIKIILPSLGYIMQAEVETGSVKVIEPGISQHYEKQTDRYALAH